MPKIVLSCPYKQNEAIISAEELLEKYFFGIKIADRDGVSLSTDVINSYIEAATQEVEKGLSIKIKPQIIKEDKDFWISDWPAWSYIRFTYPVKKAFELQGFINDVIQVTYPKEWLSVRKTNDGELFHRNMYMVPTNGSATTNTQIYNGITPHLGFFGNTQIPNYWSGTYCTGFDNVPSELLNFIGKLASINLFHILGDIILGAGIASQSIGIDGLNQSIQTTSSATNSGYGARITGYLKELKGTWPQLKAYYKGFEMTAL